MFEFLVDDSCCRFDGRDIRGIFMVNTRKMRGAFLEKRKTFGAWLKISL
jgi:hypothetical protein